MSYIYLVHLPEDRDKAGKLIGQLRGSQNMTRLAK